MGWFRANSRLGGRLALFALAVQFFLSFAHIHPEDVYGSLKAPSVAHSVSFATADREHFAASDQSAPSADDLCAICVSVSLLGNSFAAQSPKLPSPGPQTAEHTALTVAFVIAPVWGPFQSRAPPIV
jgi:hypothetical protein